MIKRNYKFTKLTAIFLLVFLAVFLNFKNVPAFFVQRPINDEQSAAKAVIFKFNEDNCVDQTCRQAVLSDYNLINAKPVTPYNQSLSGYYKAHILANNKKDLSLDSRVSWIGSDTAIKTAEIITNDPYFTTDATYEDKQWYLPKIKISEAWEYGRGTTNVIVAVIDTGVHASHVELNDGRVMEGYNTILDEPILAKSDSDDNGHGTAVAGIIGAISDNNRGIAGINRNVRIMPVKAMSSDGTGMLSDVSEGIVWATDHGASVINLSMGGPNYGSDKLLNDAIKYAYEKDVLIVSAAGNDQTDTGLNLDTSPGYPICADQGQNMVLGVAASDIDDRKASFSNFGINCIDITAPGKKILTTAYLPYDPSNNILIYGSGTSLAAPIVSGIAALLRSNNNNLSNKQVRDIIIQSADNIDKLNVDNCLQSNCTGFLGHGRINALSALSPQPILNGLFIRQTSTGRIYQINGGSKRLVPEAVFKQRGFNLSDIVNEFNTQLDKLPTIDPLLPLDQSLIKAKSNSTVYLVINSQIRPLTYTVFSLRNFSFANVLSLQDTDMGEYKISGWYWPPDGTLVQARGNPTVYLVSEDVIRPVTYFVFTQRKLSFAKVVNLNQEEFINLPRAPDIYWIPPLEDTLVKSEENSTVYLINKKSRKPISYEAFIARNYSFANVKILPQAEIDVIMPGSPIYK